jgi:hypothetical protein
MDVLQSEWVTDQAHIIETGSESCRFRKNLAEEDESKPGCSVLLPLRPPGHAPAEPSTLNINVPRGQSKPLKWAKPSCQTQVFAHPHQAYMKDTCSITVKSPARAVVPKDHDVMIAVARVGKGTVLAVVDPWVYNEYTDRRNKLPVEYDTFDAAIDLAGWAMGQAK